VAVAGIDAFLIKFRALLDFRYFFPVADTAAGRWTLSLLTFPLSINAFNSLSRFSMFDTSFDFILFFNFEVFKLHE
jgi:hypothetical protein